MGRGNSTDTIGDSSARAHVKRASTITDIASAVGMSASTVSRALRRPAMVRDQTRLRITKAAEKLGYQAHLVDPPPVVGQTNLIGLIVPDIVNPFFAALIKAAANEAQRCGRGLVLANTDGEPLAELEIINSTRQRVDGLIIASSRLGDAELKQMGETGFNHAGRTIPLVLINRDLPGVPSVLIDYRSGMRQAVEHLAALGHRAIVYAGGPPLSWSDGNRRQAFEIVVGENDVDEIILGPYAPNFDGGVQAADVALARSATAVIAYNDLMAFGVISRLLSRGIAIPAAFSVIGFDDIPAASTWSPPLTTVAASTTSVGRTAMQMVFKLMAGKSALDENHHRLASHLVIRGSTSAR